VTPPLRPSRGRDPLGLRRQALADRLLPAVVAAMALLGGLALGAAQGASRLAARWQDGAAAAIAIELPTGTAPGVTAALAARLAALPGVATAAPADPARLEALLRPWLGAAELPLLPPLIEIAPAPGADPAVLLARLEQAAPEARIEAPGLWAARLLTLARSVEAAAVMALALVASVAAAVVAVAVGAGIAARRDQIAILHDLGATDGDIAGRFASRVVWLVTLGATAGAALAAPVLAGFANRAAPLLGAAPQAGLDWGSVPILGLLALPAAAAAIGWTVAQASVRGWLWRLP